MKKTLLFFAVLFFTVQGFGQFTFGVSPGIGLNSTYFGYKINSKIVPYIGLQHFNANFKEEYSRDRYDYDLNHVVHDIDQYDISGNLFIPNVGVKYFAIQQNKLQAYFSVNVSKPFVTGKIEIGDSEWDNESEDEFVDQMKNIKMFGGEFGFGVEYFLDENFSIGGEFGFRYLNFKYSDSYASTFWNPDTGLDQATDYETDINISSSPTFSKISLNFYFQKKE